jgi:hypothetical protein
MTTTARVDLDAPDIIGTVVLGFGPQSMDWISKVSKVCGSDAVIDPGVARMAGAHLAGGTPAALDALHKRLEAGALQAERAANPWASEAATRWLANGERGMSSEAMFCHLTGIKCTRRSPSRDARTAHPYDPADLRRCRLLLEQVPELQGLLPKMAKLSGPWARLIRDWDVICSTMDAELPNWRTPHGESAPKTYALIKAAITEPAL